MSTVVAPREALEAARSASDMATAMMDLFHALEGVELTGETVADTGLVSMCIRAGRVFAPAEIEEILEAVEALLIEQGF